MRNIEPGQTLDGRYKILDVINKGGMAAIYEAVDCQTGSTVAVKAPFLRYESEPAYFQRFEREEQIGLALNHPFVIRFHPVTTPRSRPYIVMDRLEGITLAEHLEKTKPLPEAEAMQIASKVCDALEHLHANGIVHRD